MISELANERNLEEENKRRFIKLLEYLFKIATYNLSDN